MNAASFVMMMLVSRNKAYGEAYAVVGYFMCVVRFIVDAYTAGP